MFGSTLSVVTFRVQPAFASPGLVNRSPQQLATYKFQSNLHGFTLSSPGRPQHQAPLVLSHILCDIQRQFLLVMKAPIPPLRVWVKGHSKSNFVRTLLPLNFDMRNLEDLGCPVLCHISNKWLTTLSKARSLKNGLQPETRRINHSAETTDNLNSILS